MDELIRPLVDVLIKALESALEKAGKIRLKRSARKALSEAIRELLKANPDLNEAEAKIAIAKAAGLVEKDLFTAERMLDKVQNGKRVGAGPAKKRTAGKSTKKRPIAADYDESKLGEVKRSRKQQQLKSKPTGRRKS